MKKNDIVKIDIIDMTVDGSGVGKYEGMAVFVPLTAVGDTASVRILKVKKSYAYGKVEEILIPSNARIENDCPSFKSCGGCVYRHISYEKECEIKQNKVYSAIKRIGGIDLEPKEIIPSNRISHYRNKEQLPVSVSGKFGFFAKHSHRVIECESCKLQPEIFDKISGSVSEFLTLYNIKPYNEENHTGLFRHLYIRIAEKTGEILVCAVINGNTLPFADEFIKVLKGVCGENLKSVQINKNKEKTNVILGKECEVLYGENYITDILCGVKVRISPLSFYQVNRDMAECLYEKAAEYAECENKNVLDLYCGAGTIGLSMAKRAKSIVGVEIIPEAVEDAKFNAKNNGIENARFICADAAKAAEILKAEGYKPDVVIVDPPRKGCDEALLETIANGFSPERVVYVSCDSATLARDAKFLEEKGYKLIEYTPVDLFPRTAHCETIAYFISE